MKILSRSIITLSALLLFASCNKNVVFSSYESIDPDKGWERARKITFKAEINDTVQLHNVFVNVRNAEGYPYRNLFLFLTTTYPNGNSITDTLECILADEKGKWLGEGAGDLWDNSILFKQNTRFPMAGTYTFSFEQAMRYGDKPAIDPLPLILDVGITIEKAE